MKLVLLPGMDGTGLLFEPLLRELMLHESQVVSLPKNGPQDYESLTGYVTKKLPNDDFILLAESFSGAIAAAIANRGNDNLKGVIFVASFLSSPGVLLPRLASLLPIKLLMKLPFSHVVIRAFLLGGSARKEMVAEFVRAVDAVPARVLNARLSEIAHLQYKGYVSGLPAVYLGAKGDRLVKKRMRDEFQRAFPDISMQEFDGPHFLLQANPAECAAAIMSAIDLLTGNVGGRMNAPQY